MIAAVHQVAAPLVPVVRVEGVCQSFRTAGGEPLEVLSDVSFEIGDIPGHGQIRSILGPSGCGKTTLLRIVAGLDRPERGRVLLTIALRPVRVGMVGVIFQSYPLFEHLTVLGNLVEPARRGGVAASEAAERADELLSFFELTAKAGAYPVELSGGERQRVAIIQQLMTDKHFLVLDEPFSGLDMVNGLRLADMIARVAQRHTLNTILIVTHDISMATIISDTIHLIGRPRDAEGHTVAGRGASIVTTYDLRQLGLAYRPDIASLDAYHELRAEIARRFPSL